jgi:UDP-glucose 4-epimerase
VKVLVAGGAGFIGSTVASAFEQAGHTPVLLDNFSTGHRENCGQRLTYEGDIADTVLVRRIFTENPDISIVVHCAALISVPQSVAEPIAYYRENVAKTLTFVENLIECGCRRLIFSSSASIYGPTDDFGVSEESPIAPTSPYGRTKAVVEGMLADIAATGVLDVVSLRYFNPIGADPQLRSGPRSDVGPVLSRLITALDAGQPFVINGGDYPTRDGSPLRDYVHVWDLAQAHVQAAERFARIFRSRPARFLPVNLGSGEGTTVLELARAFEAVVGRELVVLLGERRAGDSIGAFSRITRARAVLNWTPKLTLRQGISDSLAWTRRLEDLAV